MSIMQSTYHEGQTIDSRYLLNRELGSGGNGTVYEAYDDQLGRKIAIKVLLNWNKVETNSYQRFEREAKVLNELVHPNIVRVYRFGRLDDGNPFLVMEFVEGETLRSLLERRKRLPCDELLAIALQICAALEFAHSRNIVHRDLKPENIVLNAGAGLTVKLLDFGLCKNIDPEARDRTLTATGFVLGSVNYMSPEQAMGRAADKEADIYSFGIILFELITGSVPFSDENPALVLMKQINNPTPRFLDEAPRSKLPVELQDLVLDCTSKNPEARPESFAAVRLALLAISKLNCKETYAPALGTTSPLQKLQKRISARSVLTLFALLSLSVAAIYCFFFMTDSGRSLLTNYLITNLPAKDSFPELSKQLERLVDSGDAKAADELLNSIIKTGQFVSLPSLERERFLLAYRSALLRKGENARAFSVSLLILRIVFESEKDLRARVGDDEHKQKTAKIDPAESEIAESLSLELLSKKLTKRQYSALAGVFISQYEAFNKFPGADLLNTSILRAKSYLNREGGQNNDARYETLRVYLDTASRAAPVDHELMRRIAHEGRDIAKRYGLSGMESKFLLMMGKRSLARGEMEWVKKYYDEVLPLSKILLMSGAEQADFYRMELGLKLGRKIEDEELKKYRPDIFRVPPKTPFHEIVLGGDKNE